MRIGWRFPPRLAGVCFLAAAAATAVAGNAAGADIALHLPIACDMTHDCAVQNLVDRDPGPGIRDFACGSLTYDGHDGTDFRVPDMAAQRRGVAVIAAADGRVASIRDGMEDISARDTGRAAVADRECGNGVVIDHGKGWRTQYCHLAKGSVSVKPGETVQAGARLGLVGLSGLTEYPHLHFSVRRDGRAVDPFAADAPPGSCGQGKSLWATEVAPALAYRGSVILNTGFAPGPVTMEAIEAGAPPGQPPDGQSPALVAYIRAIGLKKGDIRRLELCGPDGKALAQSTAPPLDRDKAQEMLFVGKRRSGDGWPSGVYTAHFTVIRDGVTALDRSFSLSLR